MIMCCCTVQHVILGATGGAYQRLGIDFQAGGRNSAGLSLNKFMNVSELGAIGEATEVCINKHSAVVTRLSSGERRFCVPMLVAVFTDCIPVDTDRVTARLPIVC